MICCVGEPPRFINVLPTAIKIAESQTAVLVCEVSGQPTPVITWKKGEENVMTGGRFRQENGNLHISVSYCHFSSSLSVLSCFFPRCMQCRRGLAMRIRSVRLSVICVKWKQDLSRLLHRTNDHLA